MGAAEDGEGLMTKVDLRVEDFEDGALPRVCASSGVAADRPYGLRATYQPAWPIVFILLGPVGWLIMFVAAVGAERRVEGSLPYADAAYQRLRAARRAAWVHLGEAVVATAGAVALCRWLGQNVALAVVVVVGAVAVGSFISVGSRPRGSVALKLSRNGRTVMLSGVSEEFAAAYRAQERHRIARRQADTAGIDPGDIAADRRG